MIVNTVTGQPKRRASKPSERPLRKTAAFGPGCMGRGEDADTIGLDTKVLGISGPAAYEEYWAPSNCCRSIMADPLIDQSAQGVKLTPRHYAYLKISEGCNHRCRFCIIPSIRGDLVSHLARYGRGGPVLERSRATGGL